MKFTAKVKHKNQITIPKDLVDCYNINRTDFIEFDLICVKKK